MNREIRVMKYSTIIFNRKKQWSYLSSSSKQTKIICLLLYADISSLSCRNINIRQLNIIKLNELVSLSRVEDTQENVNESYLKSYKKNFIEFVAFFNDTLNLNKIICIYCNINFHEKISERIDNHCLNLLRTEHYKS